MSVIAFVQSKNNDGILIAKDGILVSRDEKYELKLDIEDIFIKFKKEQNRPHFAKYKDKNVFFGKHKIIDNAERVRDFLIYWDEKDEDKELIQKTASLIEITDEFDIYNLPEQKKTLNLKLILIVGILVLVSIMLLKK